MFSLTQDGRNGKQLSPLYAHLVKDAQLFTRLCSLLMAVVRLSCESSL